MLAMAAPREVAGALEDALGRPDAQRERFRGYGVMGLPFESGLPSGFLANESVLRALGTVAGTLLGAARLALTGSMPNRQTFHLVPSHVWMVTASRAQLEGTDLGRPAPLPEQAAIGDFRIPQQGLLAVGALDFDPPIADR